MSEEKKEEPKKAWICREASADEVEDFLNQLSEDGYQLFKVERLESPIPGRHTFQIIAFDPAHVMKLMQKSQAASMAEIMKGAGFPGMPTPRGVR